MIITRFPVVFCGLHRRVNKDDENVGTVSEGMFARRDFPSDMLLCVENKL